MPSCRVRINESLNIKSATLIGDEKAACPAAWSSFIMPSCNVLINGVTYIRSGDAARVMDLTPDYVSHLARHGATVGEPSAASGSSTSCFPRRAICQFFDRHSATVRFCGGASWPRRSRHHGPKALTRLVHSPAAYAARLAKRVNEELSSFRSESMRKKRVRAARK